MESDENPTLTGEQLEKIMAQYDVPFRHEYLGTFLDEEDDPYMEIAETYYRSCHGYDKRVCTSVSPRSGEPIPSNNEEWGLINRHALRCKRELMQQYRLTGPQFHQVLKRYDHRFSYIKTNYKKEYRGE